MADTATRTAPVDAPVRRPGRRPLRILLGVAVPLGLLGLWQMLSSLQVFTPVQLPPPVSVVEAGVDLAERGLLWLYIGISAQRTLLGFVIGGGLGLLVGAVVGLSRLWEALLGGTLSAIRAVPSLAWVPLLILWMKTGEESKVTLIAIGAFFPVFTTTAAARRHVDRQLVEAARAFGYRGSKLFTTVQLPAALPSVTSGIRLALAQAWLFLVAAELIASSMGLGFLLTDSQNNGRTDRLFLAIILLAIIGKLSDSLLAWTERRAIRRWT